MAAVLLLPKCVACVVTYFALAGAAGIELCGGTENPSGVTAHMGPVAALSVVVLATAFAVRRSARGRCDAAG